jgi:hypothetical protein
MLSIVNYVNETRDPTERDDCTVWAIAVCLGISYMEAQVKLLSVGRLPGRGCPWGGAISEILGFEPHPEFSCRWLRSVLPEMQGRFIVIIAHHAFVVVDGVAWDRFAINPKCRVQMAYAPVPTVKCPNCQGVGVELRRRRTAICRVCHGNMIVRA